jgi:hypothetical protein
MTSCHVLHSEFIKGADDIANRSARGKRPVIEADLASSKPSAALSHHLGPQQRRPPTSELAGLFDNDQAAAVGPATAIAARESIRQRPPS